MVQDTDLLQPMIDHFDSWIEGFKKGMGAYIEQVVKDLFAKQGPATNDSDPLNPRGVNPAWAPLSWITIQLKGSSAILIDTRQLANYVTWRIEDSEWDKLSGVVKVGWFEESGDRAYIAAIHEYGLTGTLFRAPDGSIMGGEPIGRTDSARNSIRGWFYKNLGLKVTGRIVIPERSMLRKAADLIVPDLDDMIWASFIRYLRGIV